MKSIKIQEDLMIPGTNIILEKGDCIKFIEFTKIAGEISHYSDDYSVHINTKKSEDNEDNLDFEAFSTRVRNIHDRGYIFKHNKIEYDVTEVLNYLKDNDGSYEVWINN